MNSHKAKEFAEGKRTPLINNWVLIIFLFIQLSYEMWGVEKSVFNTVLWNVSLYGFLSYVFARLYKLEKNYLSFFAAIFWGFFTITEIWFGLNY